MAIGGDGSKSIGIAKFHLSQVPNVNGASIAELHHDVFDVLQTLDLTFTTDKKALVGFFNVATPSDGIVLLQHGINSRQVHLHRFESLRIDGYFVFFQIATPGIDFDDSFNSREISSYHPVLDGSEVGDAVLILIPRFDVDDVLVNFTQTRWDRSHDGFTKARRDAFLSNLESLSNQLPRQVSTHILLENQGDNRKTKLGNGSNLLDTRKIGHFQLNGIGEKLFDILGR